MEKAGVEVEEEVEEIRLAPRLGRLLAPLELLPPLAPLVLPFLMDPIPRPPPVEVEAALGAAEKPVNHPSRPCPLDHLLCSKQEFP